MEKSKEQKIQKLLNTYRSLPIEKQIDNRYEILSEIIDNMKYIYNDEKIARNLSNFLMNSNYNLSDFYDIKYYMVFMVPNIFIKRKVHPIWRDSIIFTLKDGTKGLVNPELNIIGSIPLIINVNNIVENVFFTYYGHTILFTSIPSFGPRDLIVMYYNYLNIFTQNSEEYQKYCMEMHISHEEFQNYFDFLDKEFAIRTQLSVGVTSNMIPDFIKFRDDIIEDINWGNNEIKDMVYNAAYHTLFPKLISNPLIASMISSEYASIPSFEIENIIDISPCYNYVLTYKSIKNCELDFNPFKSFSLLYSNHYHCSRNTLYYTGDDFVSSNDMMNDYLPADFNDFLAISSFKELSDYELKFLFYTKLFELINEYPSPHGYPSKIIYKNGPITKKELNKFMKMLKNELNL